MKRMVIVAMFAFWVVTYGGEKVAGPFVLLSDCTDIAKEMAKKFFNVSTVCRSF